MASQYGDHEEEGPGKGDKARTGEAASDKDVKPRTDRCHTGQYEARNDTESARTGSEGRRR